MKYFAPRIEGLENIKRRGTDYLPKDLDELLKLKKVYGECVDHYREHASGKSALVFCRDVATAYETADRFCAAGYKFFCIEGNMSHKKRKMLLDALRCGDIHGLTNCEIATYGLDIPRVEVGICLRPTLSKSLYFQMVGRCLRPYEGKEYAIFFDHVNNLFEHEEPDYPGVPPHYVPEIKWNFVGTKKRKRELKDYTALSLRLCPSCFIYFEGNICSNCGADAKIREVIEVETIESNLKEVKPVKLRDLPEEEKREVVDKISNAIFKFRDTELIDKGAVGDLLKIAKELGHAALWVYWKFTPPDRKSVNVSLLHEIARQSGFKAGWAWHQQKNIKKKIIRGQIELEQYRQEFT